MSGIMHLAGRRAARLLVAVVIVLGIVSGVGFAPTPAHAEPLPGLPCDQNTLASGEITLVCLPPAWNGALVVYAHGYVDPALPLALPAELNLYLPDGTPNPASLPAILLGQGYAVATTSYSKNGYVVQQGGKEIDALVAAVREAVGRHNLKQVYLVGASQGALIGTMLVERDPKTYNGGVLALCGPLAGWLYQTRYTGDFAVVFDYFFPGVAAQGQAAVVAALSDPANAPAVQQLFSVTGAAVDPGDPSTAVASALSILFFSSPAVTADLIATAEGNPYGNLLTYYHGSLNDQALNAGVARIAPDLSAMRYVRRYYTPDGDSKRPIVTLHNRYDPVVPFKHEQIFALRLLVERNLRQLTQLTSSVPYGHCNFPPEEILSAFGVLVARSN